MKRLLTILLATTLTLSMVACGINADEEKKAKQDVQKEEVEVIDEDKEQEEEVKNTDKENQEKEETPVVETQNYFFNDTNNTYDINAISIKPRYVYWQDGCLYAECFVINGFAHNVYNINVKSLSVANNNGVIAAANFSTLDGVTLAPYSHIVWTFCFSVDCVNSPNADLSQLIVSASTSNNY